MLLHVLVVKKRDKAQSRRNEMDEEIRNYDHSDHKQQHTAITNYNKQQSQTITRSNQKLRHTKRRLILQSWMWGAWQHGMSDWTQTGRQWESQSGKDLQGENPLAVVSKTHQISAPPRENVDFLIFKCGHALPTTLEKQHLSWLEEWYS